MSLAFVASTLPALILKLKIEDWNVSEIIVSNRSLYETFNYLTKNFENIKLTVVPDGFLNSLRFMIFRLAIAKFKKERVFFFHECCCLIFDLVINIINNKADFFPQVSMNTFEEISVKNVSKETILLKWLKQTSNFKSYKLIHDNDSGFSVIWSCKKYNENISVHSLDESIKIKYKNYKPKLEKHNGKKQCLLLLGTDLVNNENIIINYSKLINFLSKEGFEIYLKDHPNVENQLNKDGKLKGHEVPSFIPVELIDDYFDIVIGVASTGLVNFPFKAFSILNLMQMSKKNILLRKKHLTNLIDGKEIVFLKKNDYNFSEIKNYIDNLNKNHTA